MVNLYNTAADYPNATGFLKILYPLKDAILVVNPFFFILHVVLIVLSISSYYLFTNMTGRTKYLASINASAFITFIVSVFFALADLISAYQVLYFLAILAMAFAFLIFYKK